jgi:hypothetical protein
MGKHVIFLGAGASETSGYPLANELRLLMTSPVHLRPLVLKAWQETHGSTERIQAEMLERKTLDYRTRFEAALGLLRQGGFASVDEFCRLSRATHSEGVRDLKRWMRLCLSIRDPELTFEKSDYYPFLQRLFEADTPDLREDTTILSFNYDVYLEFLLSRAYRVRVKAAGASLDEAFLNAHVFSAMRGRDTVALEDGSGFCLLKLHGSIAWPEVTEEDGSVGFRHLFDVSPTKRIEGLCQEPLSESDPPVLFPWEAGIFKPSTQGPSPFILQEKQTTSGWRQGAYRGSVTPEDLFRAIWNRAQREISRATKISFVGISFHHYLDAGFRYLLHSAKAEHLETLVIACPEVVGSDEMRWRRRFCDRILGFFHEVQAKKIEHQLEWRFQPTFEAFIKEELHEEQPELETSPNDGIIAVRY